MRAPSREDGFTLIELLVVTGLIVVVVATLGAFFLGGPSPAVASAARDIDAALDEARETATAFNEATLVFAAAGSGYSARVYRAIPGNAQFQAVNGPAYESTVTIAETAAPLGAPGFAFRIDSRGSVTGYQHFNPATGTFTERACPASGAFVLALAYEREKRTIDVPCLISLAMNAPAVTDTPVAARTPPPYAPGTCAPSPQCLATLPPFTATCPPGYTPDATQPNVCDSPTPAPTSTPSVAFSPQATTPPSVSPPPSSSPIIATCTSGAACDILAVVSPFQVFDTSLGKNIQFENFYAYTAPDVNIAAIDFTQLCAGVWGGNASVVWNGSTLTLPMKGGGSYTYSLTQETGTVEVSVTDGLDSVGTIAALFQAAIVPGSNAVEFEALRPGQPPVQDDTYVGTLAGPCPDNLNYYTDPVINSF